MFGSLSGSHEGIPVWKRENSMEFEASDPKMNDFPTHAALAVDEDTANDGLGENERREMGLR